MARDYSPVDSPLSSMDSSSDAYDEEAAEDVAEDATEFVAEGADEEEELVLRPTKRLKIVGGAGSTTSSAVAVDPEPEPELPPDSLEGLSDVSSDTSGDVPSSPVNVRGDEEDLQEQVTVCIWDGCAAGDLSNLDRLVEHIHNEHVENRARKYTCEWRDCARKGMAHASGYALKAHMRKHTREKPFYCYLPECDRSFTRSDALAKHMRTVHETEALRPSDPVTKSTTTAQGGGGGGGPGPSSTAAASASAPKPGHKLKIIIRTPQSHTGGQDDAIDHSPGEEDDIGEDAFTALTSEHGFDPGELEMGRKRLYTVCRRQLAYAEAEAEELSAKTRRWEEMYLDLWREKEVLLSQVVQSEVDWHERREAILAGKLDLQVGAALGVDGGGSGGGVGVGNGNMSLGAGGQRKKAAP